MEINEKCIKNQKSYSIVFKSDDGNYIKCFHDAPMEMEDELYLTKKYSEIGSKVLEENIICTYKNKIYCGFKIENVGHPIWYFLDTMSLSEKRLWARKYKLQFENIFKYIAKENSIYMDLNFHNFTLLNKKIYLIDYDPFFVLLTLKFDETLRYDIMCFIFNMQCNNCYKIRNYLKYHHTEKEIKKIIFNHEKLKYIYDHYYKESLNTNGFGYKFI